MGSPHESDGPTTTFDRDRSWPMPIHTHSKLSWTSFRTAPCRSGVPARVVEVRLLEELRKPIVFLDAEVELEEVLDDFR
jgi:hypothetical protein